MIGLKTGLRAALVAGLFVSASPSLAQLNPGSADDAFRMSTKVFCSLRPGEEAIYYWEGTVYSRVRGEKDRHLFNVQAMNIRQCQPLSDPVRGVGSRAVSREIMLYLDPVTKQVLRTWKNPWSGEEVEVVHVQNDPVNAREPSWSRDEQGKPKATSNMTMIGGYAHQGGGAARLFYENPLAGDYQDYVGNHYHASEFLTASVPVADLTNASATRVQDSVISWGRISRWMPWMKMGSRDGLLVHYTGGLRLDSWDELPEQLKTEIRNNYPEYRKPPPVDDARPNATSWTVMKKRVDAARAKAGRP